LGRFLEGTFAPLVFLWLVMGYFLQQKELSENTTAIQKQHIEIQKVPNGKYSNGKYSNGKYSNYKYSTSVLHSQQQFFIRFMKWLECP
jgi:hypothetical protein